MTLGVTAGKFYPLHLGHDLLIRDARRHVDRLPVLVAWKPGQRISGAVRAGWIRARHPDVVVIEVLDDIPDASAPWAARTREVLGRAPDVVFTPESYGDTWAARQRTGCRIEWHDHSGPRAGAAAGEGVGAGIPPGVLGRTRARWRLPCGTVVIEAWLRPRCWPLPAPDPTT